MTPTTIKSRPGFFPSVLALIGLGLRHDDISEQPESSPIENKKHSPCRHWKAQRPGGPGKRKPIKGVNPRVLQNLKFRLKFHC